MVFILSLRICTHVVNESRRTPSAAYREYNQMDQCLCFCLVPYAKEEHQHCRQVFNSTIATVRRMHYMVGIFVFGGLYSTLATVLPTYIHVRDCHAQRD